MVEGRQTLEFLFAKTIPGNKMRLMIRSLFLAAVVSLLTNSPILFGQNDTIQRVGGSRPLRGQIEKMTTNEVRFKTSGNSQTIKVSEIDRIRFGEAKGNVRQALDQYYSGNYNDCLDSLQRITSSPTNQYLKAELAFCKAMSMAGVALGGGNVTLKNAKSELANFVQTYQENYRYFDASYQFSRICIAAGDLAVAKSGFSAVLKSDSAGQKVRARIALGQIGLMENDYNSAAIHLSAATKIDSSDRDAATLKQIANCRLAQANCLRGQDPAGNMKIIQDVIKNQSSENKFLFANAYNALGHCQLKAGQSKPALLSFLHTQMLFTGQQEEQAEALDQIYRIWNQLNYPGRARQAQTLLRQSYRSTYYGNPEVKR